MVERSHSQFVYTVMLSQCVRLGLPGCEGALFFQQTIFQNTPPHTDPQNGQDSDSIRNSRRLPKLS